MATAIGNKFLTNILLNAISASSDTVSRLLGNVFTKVIGNNEVVECLTELDIESTIRTVELIIKDLKQLQLSESITLCLEQLTEIIMIIENDLSTIYEMLKFNKICYFPSWRSYDLTNNLKKLQTNNKILMKRFNLLNTVIGLTKSQKKFHKNSMLDLDEQNLTKSTLLICKTHNNKQ